MVLKAMFAFEKEGLVPMSQCHRLVSVVVICKDQVV